MENVLPLSRLTQDMVSPPSAFLTPKAPRPTGTLHRQSRRWPGGGKCGESGQEEGEVTQAEGDEPGSFTQMKSRDTDTESKDTTPGRDSWRSARGRETVLLYTPRTRGQGKRRMEWGRGTTKRPRMDS